ncbi:MAG: iron chelate uptake ABC transporter family permease subunit [Oscillospiraceae bacterium]|jgi:iron complex transport system permease protein|nr:iron chelate uptake ABC transporter family permease subunit [Oscillospiraceae bacterium]
MTTLTLIEEERKRAFRHNAVVHTALFAAVITFCLLEMSLGENRYPISVILRVLSGEQIEGASFVIGDLRLPRMLAGLLVGSAFGVSGAVFQSMLRNPLASPDIIGVSSGSTAAAVFCILVLRRSGTSVSLAAIIAGIASAALIYALSRGGKFSGGRLILVGIGVGAIFNSIVSYLLLRANQYDVPGAMRWISGSLNGVVKAEIMPSAVAAVILFPMILFAEKRLKIIELGEDIATALGMRANRTRLFLVISTVCLIAISTSVTGPVAFVAFLSGPISKRMTGRGAPSLPAAALTGAALTMGSDLVGQFAFGTRFPVGVITGIIGAPYLLFLLIKINKSGGSA